MFEHWQLSKETAYPMSIPRMILFRKKNSTHTTAYKRGHSWNRSTNRMLFPSQLKEEDEYESHFEEIIRQYANLEKKITPITHNFKALIVLTR